MKRTLVGALLALATACAQVDTPETNKILTAAAKVLQDMPFDGATITVTGRLGTLVWPEGSNGMIVIEAAGGEKYAFSTARVAPMAKLGFSRFTAHPGQEVIITGVLAKDHQKIGPGFKAARADVILKSDGTRLFERSRLP